MKRSPERSTTFLQGTAGAIKTNTLIIAHFPAERKEKMKGKMKKVIEMTQILTDMDADAYMQCKYMLLVVSNRHNGMNHLVKVLFSLTDEHRPLCIGMKEGGTL